MASDVKWLFLLVAAMELAAVGWAWYKSRRYRGSGLIAPQTILIGGTFLTALALFFGLDCLNGPENGFWMRTALALHKAIRIFVVDLDVNEYLFAKMDAFKVKDTMTEYIGSGLFKLFIGGLFVFAPCLTFEFFLSFFSDTRSHAQLIRSMMKDKYIFSELNEKSITLAESIQAAEWSGKDKARRKIVFAGVDREMREQNDALIERAKLIGAILCKRDVSAIKFGAIDRMAGKIRKAAASLPGKKREECRLAFFAIGEDRADNVKVAAQIREDYRNRKNTTLYIFSSAIEAEMFASSKMDETIEIRCVNEARSLVYRTLYDMETARKETGAQDLFDKAAQDGPVKTITAVIVGLGALGQEMLKTLAWFCQMDGYRVKIHAFDREASAESRFRAACPELMEKSGAVQNDEGDAKYEITIHSEADVESAEFAREVGALTGATYVFVALGSDEANIAAAVRLRRLFKQAGINPVIHAVVGNPDKAQIVSGCRNFRGMEYGIQSVGDMRTQYSEGVILNSELEEEALKIHIKYGKSAAFDSMTADEQAAETERLRKQFYAYEYFYRSSLASALHLKARIACGLQGEGAEEDERKLSILEHCRWNAYMRTEGYRFSGSLDRKSRDDMAKLHNLMVPFGELPPEEQEKDRRISL